MNRPKQAFRGFTLIELLVVIGIIGLLIAILVPVISKVRKAAQNAATQNTVNQIASVIENYYHDYQAYPGPTPGAQFGALGPMWDPSLANLTGTEDLVIALMGGLDNSSGKLIYKPALLGNGPISLNPSVPGQKKAYMDARPGMLAPVPVPDPLQAPFKSPHHQEEWLASITADTSIPEFVDQYSDFRPLLYLRANPGASTAGTNKIVSDTYQADVHYNLKPIQTYLRTSAQGYANPDILARGAADQDVIKYFTGSIANKSGTAVSARGAGSFMLISAGPDRVFGNDDDILYTGGGGQ